MYKTYYPNGNLYIIEQRYGCKRHSSVLIFNVTGQNISILNYYYEGEICAIEYRQNRLLHNLHGPAYMEWSITGLIHNIEYRQNGLYHNLHGPTYFSWHTNGKISRIEYRQNGLLHNLHGIAYMSWCNTVKLVDVQYYHFGRLIKDIAV